MQQIMALKKELDSVKFELTRLQMQKSSKSPRLLELFCGTGSVGKVATNLPEGFEVTSVDIDKKANPTILTDILT